MRLRQTWDDSVVKVSRSDVYAYRVARSRSHLHRAQDRRLVAHERLVYDKTRSLGQDVIGKPTTGEPHRKLQSVQTSKPRIRELTSGIHGLGFVKF